MTEYSALVESKLKAMSLSPDAAAWVMKALDPVRSAPCQIPDAVQTSVLLPEFRQSVVISKPEGVSENWDVCIVLPPSDTVAAMYATGPPGTDFAGSVATANYVLSNTDYRLSSSSLRGLGFVNSTGAPTLPFNFRAVFSSELPAMWRTSSRSATVYATGSDLYNQGTVYAGQYSRTSAVTGGQAIAADDGGAHVALTTEVVDLPLSESTMSVITPGNTYYTASAREGVYTVHRLTGPAQEFTQLRTLTGWRSSDGVTNYINATDPTNYTSQSASVARFRNDSFVGLSPNFPPTNLHHASTSFDQNCTWGVIIFRGLHPQMTLTLKTYTTLEIVPSVDAPSRQFVKPPIRYEPTAMAAYYALATSMPCSMAARHNFLGTILPILSSVASRVLPFLAPVAGQMLSALGQRVAGAAAPSPQAPQAPAPTPRPLRVRASSVASSIRSRAGKKKAKRRVRVARSSR